MKHASLVIALSCLFLPLLAAADDWEVGSEIPYHVYGHAGAALDGKVHLMGGCHTDDWQVPSMVHQVYDPENETWGRQADLPLATGWSMPAVLDGKLYLFGGGYYKEGQGMTSTNRAWAYDPSADRWRELQPMPEPRMNGFAAAAGGAIYIAQGYDRQGGGDDDVRREYRSTYRYDPATDAYTQVADAPETGCYIASGAYQGKIYSVPGSYDEYGFHGEYTWADGALEYDPQADKWTQIDAPRVEKRVFFLTQCSASVISDGKLWIVGGMAENRQRTTKTEYLDIERRVFVRGPDIEYGRCCGGAGIVDGMLAILGGFVDGKGLGTPARATWKLRTDGSP